MKIGLVVAGMVMIGIGLYVGYRVSQSSRPPGLTAADSAAIAAPAIKAHTDSILARASVAESIAAVHADSEAFYRNVAVDYGDSLKLLIRKRRVSVSASFPNPVPTTGAAPALSVVDDEEIPMLIDPSDDLPTCAEKYRLRSLRDVAHIRALAECDAGKDTIKTSLAEVKTDLAKISRRADSIPIIIANVRKEPRSCKRSWGLFSLSCADTERILAGTAFVGGLTIGIVAAQ